MKGSEVGSCISVGGEFGLSETGDGVLISGISTFVAGLELGSRGVMTTGGIDKEENGREGKHDGDDG